MMKHEKPNFLIKIAREEKSQLQLFQIGRKLSFCALLGQYLMPSLNEIVDAILPTAINITFRKRAEASAHIAIALFLKKAAKIF